MYIIYICVCVCKPFLHRAWYEYAGGLSAPQKWQPNEEAFVVVLKSVRALTDVPANDLLVSNLYNAVVTNVTNRGPPPQLFGFHLDLNRLYLPWASTMSIYIFSDFRDVSTSPFWIQPLNI